MSDYPMLISNKLHSFRNFGLQMYTISAYFCYICASFTTDYAEWHSIFAETRMKTIVIWRRNGSIED